MVRRLLVILLLLPFSSVLNGQPANCTFKPPFYTIHFGNGDVSDLNEAMLPYYTQVFNACPTDGHYSYTSSTSGCFQNDWQNLTEDHTSGDQDGNMMLVNAAYYKGTFLSTTISGFKGGTTYQFGAWMMNLCRITKKCPSLLLPNITILLHSPEGKLVASFTTGELQRLPAPYWKQYKGIFTVPPSTTTLRLTMIDEYPSGCGNDFALDDITFQECIKTPPTVAAKPKTTVKRQPPPAKHVARKKAPIASTKKGPAPSGTEKPPITVPELIPVVSKPGLPAFPPPPPVLITRTNNLVKKIEAVPGQIRVDLYDNGQIDGDTITVYHNNQLVVAHAALAARPVTFYITVDAAVPHHELVMVANNLGAIPPNTSLMIVTAGGKRHEVFISSSKQKNAKVTIDLK